MSENDKIGLILSSACFLGALCTKEGRQTLGKLFLALVGLALLAWVGYMILNSSIAVAIVAGAALIAFAIFARR